MGKHLQVSGVTPVGSIIVFNANGFASDGGLLASSIIKTGGNSFGADMTMGTNDNFALIFKTNNSPRAIITTSGALGIGSTVVDASAIVDIISTIRGFGLPSMQAAQRTGISTPRDGLMVYQNDGSTGVYARVSGGWIRMGTVLSIGLTGAEFSFTGSPVTTSGNIGISLATSGITADTYNGTVTFNNKGIATAGTKKSQTAVTPVLNAAFQISATQAADVNYSINIQIVSALAGTNTGTVQLQISATSGGVYTTISQSGISLSGVLSTIGNTQTVSGYIPPGFWVKIITAATGANAGSAVFTAQPSQHTIY